MSAIPSPGEVAAAARLLRDHFPPTRLVPAPSLGPSIWLKLESELPTGSFKVRGAIYALAVNRARRNITEVVAASTGNHGAAVAYASHLLGIPARIFLPSNANEVKKRRIAALGAAIVEDGRDIAVAAHNARHHANRDGVYLLDDATDPDLPAGPATIGLEIVEQLPTVQTIIVPIGDSALIRGTAGGTTGRGVRLVGVQAERAPSYWLSMRERRAVPTESCDTIADGLATRTPHEANVAALLDAVSEIVLVSEAEILAAMRHLLLQEHVVAEPSGAAATAALLRYPELAKGNVVALVTGANVTEAMLQRALR